MHKLLFGLFLAIGVLTAQAEVKINNIWFQLDRKGKLATVVPAEDGSHAELETVVIPHFVVYNCEEYMVIGIGENAFRECKKLKTVLVHQYLSFIGEEAFAHCSALRSFALLDEDEEDRAESYYQQYYDQYEAYCDGYKSKAIHSYTGGYIGASAFDECTALETVQFPERIYTLKYGAFWGCSALKSIDLPEALVLIEADVFWACAALESVTMHERLKYICEGAFAECPALREVVNFAAKPQKLQGEGCSSCDAVFHGIDLSRCTLYVLQKSLPKYRKTAVWQDFGQILSVTDLE